MNKYLIFDIEAKPDIDLAQASGYFDNIKPPNNYKDEEKIEAWINAKREKLIDDLALNPKFARVYLASFCNAGKITVVHGDNEKKLIDFIGKSIYEAYKAGSEIVTFNGCKYDFPVIIERGQINRVKLPYRLFANMKRAEYRFNHYDLYKTHDGSLELNSQVRFGESKPNIDFKNSSLDEWVIYSGMEMGLSESLYLADNGIFKKPQDNYVVLNLDELEEKWKKQLG